VKNKWKKVDNLPFYIVKIIYINKLTLGNNIVIIYMTLCH
jgi:hypothetical protein